MLEQLKDQYDIVIVGSGAAGLVGAIAAAKRGLSAVIIEKAKVWGGTSALSGGAMWIPANHLMAEDGEPDSYEDAMSYLKLALEDAGPATAEERQRAFLLGAPRMLRLVMNEGASLVREPHQPDYLPSLPHARIGRAIEPCISDANQLGEASDTLRRYPGTLPALRLGELASIGQGFSTLQGIKTLLKVGLRQKILQLRGKKPLGMGAALVAELMQVVRRLKIPLVLNCRLEDVLLQDGRVVGITCEHGAAQRTVSTHSLLLTAGGFAHSVHRQQLQATDGRFSLASPEDTGDMLSVAERIDADLELLDSAWWGCVVKYPNGVAGFTVSERSTPGSIIVDQRGSRFTNEAQNYNLVGRAIRAHVDQAWLILDSRHRRKYRFGLMLPGRTPQQMFDSGFFKRASTIEELARACGIDPPALAETVRRFNAFARAGVDQDFHRGENAYENYWGDPHNKPNPNLGPIDKPPYLATRVYAGDTGTRGGFLTDGHGRVLRRGKPIDGLYASGNCTASIFGRGDPGPGGTLSPAMTFAFLAAEHIAGEYSSLVQQRVARPWVRNLRSAT
jgi:3-oxosteroid 1-dehydrogenase